MIPFSTLGERLDFWLKAAIAYAFMGFLFILNVSALPYPLSGADKIPFILITIYYWSIYRPTFLAPLLVFVAGILFDLLTGGPLGLHAILFLLAHMVITDQRHFLMGQSFFMIWLGFGLLNVVIVILQWLIFGMLHWHFLPILAWVKPIMLGFLSYPFIAFALHMTHKILPAPEMALTRQSREKEFGEIE